MRLFQIQLILTFDSLLAFCDLELREIWNILTQPFSRCDWLGKRAESCDSGIPEVINSLSLHKTGWN